MDHLICFKCHHWRRTQRSLGPASPRGWTTRGLTIHKSRFGKYPSILSRSSVCFSVQEFYLILFLSNIFLGFDLILIRFIKVSQKIPFTPEKTTNRI